MLNWRKRRRLYALFRSQRGRHSGRSRVLVGIYVSDLFALSAKRDIAVNAFALQKLEVLFLSITGVGQALLGLATNRYRWRYYPGGWPLSSATHHQRRVARYSTAGSLHFFNQFVRKSLPIAH